MENKRDKTLLIRENKKQRLDILLSAELPHMSRSRIKKLIDGALITVGGKKVNSGYQPQVNDVIHIIEPENEIPAVKGENIALNIVYEDEYIVVVDKPSGMVVHPAAGHYENTLVNALLYHCGDLSGINGVERPGIVHRIDKDTSGLLVAAKNDAAHKGLTAQWKNHDINRVYRALVCGNIKEPAGIIDAPIGRHKYQRKKMAVVMERGKAAVTHYRVIERLAGYTLIDARLETGRTHQIRVHMAYLGHPLAGDPLYGSRGAALILPEGQALHAAVLGFRHPKSGQWLEFKSPLPDYFQNLLENLRKA
jgi:23S rRNA pseudouridine1911/1915/1917 synthase